VRTTGTTDPPGARHARAWPAAFTVDSLAGRAHSAAMDQADLRDIEATLAGREQAYARLVRRYQNEITKRMWRFTRDRRELEEMVHDVFVEAYIGLKGYRGKAPFVHWLNRIATRVGYRAWKQQRRRALHEIPLQDWDEFVESDDNTLEAAEAGEMLHNLLGQLPPRDRLVLTLIYLEDLSVAQAAERCGWTLAMVKVQAHRARKKLRALFEKSQKGQGLKQ